jgi:hypothetical protein
MRMSDTRLDQQDSPPQYEVLDNSFYYFDGSFETLLAAEMMIVIRLS